MAETGFPRTRHVDLWTLESAGPSLSDLELHVQRVQAAAVPLARLEGRGGDRAVGVGALGESPLSAPLPGALPSAAPEVAADLKTGAPAAAPEAVGEPAPRARRGKEPEIARVAWVDLSLPQTGETPCEGLDGEAKVPLRCACLPDGIRMASDLAARAARAGDAVLLSGLSRWARAVPRESGACKACAAELVRAARESYGEHVDPFELSVGSARFAGIQRQVALLAPLRFARAAILRARDEARRERSVEIAVLGQVGPLDALALSLCPHLDGLLFDLPRAPYQALFALATARAALGLRAAIGVLPADAGPHAVRQLAALAAACDADVALQEGALPAAQDALAEFRLYLSRLRERFRPHTPLHDVELFVSARSAHATLGGHLESSAQVFTALSRVHLQPGVRVAVGPSAERGPVLVLAECAALTEAEGGQLERWVASGGDALVFGTCAVTDDEGRLLRELFTEAAAGEVERIGEGRVARIAGQRAGEAGGDLPDAVQLAVVKAARDLIGRGRHALTLGGRAHVLARAFLDAERKLDVHFVNLDAGDTEGPPRAQGLLLHLAGQVAGASRSGYWFSPERDAGRDGERIALNPSGFAVSTVLPAMGTCALLTIPR